MAEWGKGRGGGGGGGSVLYGGGGEGDFEVREGLVYFSAPKAQFFFRQRFEEAVGQDIANLGQQTEPFRRVQFGRNVRRVFVFFFGTFGFGMIASYIFLPSFGPRVMNDGATRCIPQGLKPALLHSLDVQAEAWTYPRCKGNDKNNDLFCALARLVDA